jgi:small-conductance mechanosensitive channel
MQMTMAIIAERFFQTQVEPFIRAALLIVIGYFIARILGATASKGLIKHLSPQQTMLLRRLTFYLVFVLFIASAIQQLGFHIGAAGILTVAIGIASQTSMSNIVSGIFMIGEKPFEVGHTVKIADLQGDILSIDLLSVKIRTADNTMVRIPNETLIKSAIINLSYFPIRRADLSIGVAYKENLEHVKTVLFDVADKNPLCLMEPKPLLQILGFGDSAINLQFSVWVSRPHFLELKSNIHADIKAAFDEQKIEMPFPSRSLFAGSGSEPLPIKIISS